MRHIYTNKNWLIDDSTKMIDCVGGYDGQWTNKFYNFWISNLTETKKYKDNKYIKKFYQFKRTII